MAPTVGICDLPDEVLCYMFTKLDFYFVIKCVTNVCQRWRSIVANSKIFVDNVQFIVDADLFMGHSYLDKEPVRQSTVCLRDQRAVGLEPWTILIGEKDLEIVPKLQSLKIIEGSAIMHQSVDLLTTVIITISKRCNNIENVEFSNCFGALSNQFMRLLRKRYNNIKEIRFGWKPDMYRVPYDEIARFTYLNTLVSHDKVFKSSDLFLLAHCNNLRSLWILFCRLLDISDVLYFLDKKKNILKELGLGISVEDVILDKLKECHNLEVFFATYSSKVTDTCIKSFAYQSRLKYCSLHQATFQPITIIEIAGLGRKPEMFTHLKVLDLTGYSNFSSQFSQAVEAQIMDSSGSSRTNCDVKAAFFRSKGLLEITFNNTVQDSVKMPYFISPQEKEHWMYRHRH